MAACSYVGNSDVYGLGIRVGIYLQWISGLISKTFLNEEALRDVLNENVIFLLAIFLATVLLVTDTISDVHQVDILIMLHIFFGSIYTIFYDERILERIDYLSSFMGILFKSSVATGMAAIGIWFWFISLIAPEDPGCSSFAFLFGRVGLYSKHTMMSFKAFSVLNMIICGGALLSSLAVRAQVWFYMLILGSTATTGQSPAAMQGSISKHGAMLRRWRILVAKVATQTGVPAKGYFQENYAILQKQAIDTWIVKQRSIQERLRTKVYFRRPADLLMQGFGMSVLMALQNEPMGSVDPYFAKGDLTFIDRASSLVLNGPILIYSIVSIELLIRFNGITDVYTILSTGQIIPFIIGIASLWKVAWKVVMLHVEKTMEKKIDSDEAGAVGGDEASEDKNGKAGVVLCTNCSNTIPGEQSAERGSSAGGDRPAGGEGVPREGDDIEMQRASQS